MDYSEIINSSFRLAWRYKSLWLLGLFASGFGLYSFQSGFEVDPDNYQLTFPGLEGIQLPETPIILAAAGAIVLLLLLASILLNAICTPAIVDAVNRLTRGGVYTLGASFSTGTYFMWRTLGILLLHFFTYVVLVGMLALVVVLLAVVNPILIIIAVLFGIPIGMLLIFAIETVFQLTYRVLVVRDVPIADAFAEAFALLRARPGPCAILFLLYFVLIIAISMIAAAIFFVMAVPFVLLAMASNVGLILALLFGIPLYWIISLPISGFLGAVFETMYTLFYFRLVEPVPAPAPAPQAG